MDSQSQNFGVLAQEKENTTSNPKGKQLNYSGNNTVFVCFCFRIGTNVEGQETGKILILEKAQLIFSPYIGNFKELQRCAVFEEALEML